MIKFCSSRYNVKTESKIPVLDSVMLKSMQRTHQSNTSQVCILAQLSHFKVLSSYLCDILYLAD